MYLEGFRAISYRVLKKSVFSENALLGAEISALCG
jgi:hypothetical protein